MVSHARQSSTRIRRRSRSRRSSHGRMLSNGGFIGRAGSGRRTAAKVALASAAIGRVRSRRRRRMNTAAKVALASAAVGLIAATALSRTQRGKRVRRSASRARRKLTNRASRVGRAIRRQAAAAMPYIDDLVHHRASLNPDNEFARGRGNPVASARGRSPSRVRTIRRSRRRSRARA